MTNEKPWYKKWWAIILFIFFGIIVIASLGDNSNDSNITTSLQQQTEAPEEIVAVFDLEVIYGKNLDEIKTILGTPDYDNEPPATYVQYSDIRTWDKTWNKSGYSLSATYNIDTKEIIELFLGSDSDASLIVFRDTNNILKVGNLSANSDQYSIEFIKLKAILGKSKSETPNGYTGAIIRKK